MRFKSKYRAKITEIDGIKFRSQIEGAYYKRLLLLKRAGKITHFDLHPIFTLTDTVKYQADFTIYYPDNTIEVVDVKGFSTTDFKIKRKLFNEFHPLRPLIVIKGKKVRGEYCFEKQTGGVNED